MRLKFWRWAHRRAEALWHWIYYHKLPNGIAEMERAIQSKNIVYSYSWEYKKSDEKLTVKG